MTDDEVTERDVRRMLEGIARGEDASLNGRGAAFILELLSRPVLPEELTDEAVTVVSRAVHEAAGLPFTGATNEQIRLYKAGHRALYAHLTKPATKEVEVWRVEWAERSHAEAPWWPVTRAFWTRRDADEFTNSLRDEVRQACIHVTGPHKQTVPA